MKDLKQGSDTLLKWFTDNLLKANSKRYPLLVNTNEKRHLNVGEIEISNSKCEKQLGIKIINSCLIAMSNPCAKRLVKK